MEHQRPSGRERDSDMAQREAESRAEAYGTRAEGQGPSAIGKVVDGFLYGIGFFVATAICGYAVGQIYIAKIEDVQSIKDDALLKFGPSTEAERIRYRYLGGE